MTKGKGAGEAAVDPSCPNSAEDIIFIIIITCICLVGAQMLHHVYESWFSHTG